MTIAAAIGAGGLYDTLPHGLSMVDSTVILAGAIPVALLALLADAGRCCSSNSSAGHREAAVAGGRRSGRDRCRADHGRRCRGMAHGAAHRHRVEELRARSCSGTAGQTIERYAGLPVDRRLNLGGTFICDRALRGGLDVYVEKCSSTALTAIYKQPVSRDSRGGPREHEPDTRTPGSRPSTRSGSTTRSRSRCAPTSRARANCQSCRSLARLLKLAGGVRLRVHRARRRVPRARGRLRADIPGAASVMDLTLIYRALAEGQVDVVAGDATAGLIDALHLMPLEDDKHYFPPYDAIPLVRAATLLRYPEIGRALKRLAGRVDAAAMRRMNFAVDGNHRDPAVVVREFLDSF